MSRATIRASVAEWFGRGNVVGLTDVLPSIKSVLQAKAFMANEGDQYGALGEVFIKTEQEYRLSPPSGGGKKHVHYECALGVRFVYVPRAGSPDVDGQADDPAIDAVNQHDVLIDNIKRRARTDPRIGQTDQVIWQFAEGDGNQTPDIRVENAYPQTLDDGTLLIWSEIWFVVKEEIIA